MHLSNGAVQLPAATDRTVADGRGSADSVTGCREPVGLVSVAAEETRDRAAADHKGPGGGLVGSASTVAVDTRDGAAGRQQRRQRSGQTSPKIDELPAPAVARVARRPEFLLRSFRSRLGQRRFQPVHCRPAWQRHRHRRLSQLPVRLDPASHRTWLLAVRAAKQSEPIQGRQSRFPGLLPVQALMALLRQ